MFIYLFVAVLYTPPPPLLLFCQVMTAEFKATKNMDASNTYAVLTVMSAIMLVFPAMYFEGSAAKESFDQVEDKARLLKVTLFYFIYLFISNPPTGG